MDVSRLGFDPHLGWALLIALGVAALVVWVLYLVRGGRAWLTRALALTLIAAALSNPLWIQENRDPLKSTLAVILDKSSSMEVDDRASTAQAISDRVRAELADSEQFDLRFVETRETAPDTRLATAITSALADTPRDQIAGAIVISDGQVHDVPTDPSSLEAFGPVHGLIVGSEDDMDRRIEITSAPSYGIVGDTAVLEVKITAEDSQTLPVDVTLNGERAKIVPLPTGETANISVEIDRRGPNTIVLSIPESPDELTAANNLTAMTLTGIRDTLRVLLITGEPHQGGRAWRDLLKADPMVDLVHFTILRPPHKQDTTPTDELALIAFPTRELFEEKLDEFDLIIFDRYRRRGVLHLRYLQNIARYVDRGGALLISAGEPFAGPASLQRTPLSTVLPLAPTGQIEEKPFKPVVSDIGKRHSVTRTLNEADFGSWYRYIDARPITGNILLTTPDDKPLLALDRVGEGRVAELMSDQLWLWARGHDGGGPFAELIRRLVHWMMKEPELEEERLILRSEGDEIIANLTSLSPVPEQLELTTPDGNTERFEWTNTGEDTLELRFPGERLGLYRGKVGDLEAIHLNGPSQPREYADLRSSTEVMEPLASATNGSVRRVSSADNVPEIRASGSGGAGGNWIGIRDRNAYVVRDSSSTPILPAWLVAGMLFGLLLLAWRREGR
ncbi:MAG: hypothetical protein CMK09_03835 [Ponticaulis sp.]|nr:hypothetical protein [Ponticaulis sp.]|tara:strand:+ start:1413 stop:3440 length:2028 start_codon:yes stop_codon:yes gene_type:complete